MSNEITLTQQDQRDLGVATLEELSAMSKLDAMIRRLDDLDLMFKELDRREKEARTKQVVEDKEAIEVKEAIAEITRDSNRRSSHEYRYRELRQDYTYGV